MTNHQPETPGPGTPAQADGQGSDSVASKPTRWRGFDTPCSRGPFAIFMVGLLLLCFLPVLGGWDTFYFRDFGIFGYPLAHYHKTTFWQGVPPVWNPYNSLGLPFLAQWNTLTLYPGSLIYLLLPLPWSLNLFCLAHLFLGAMGMHGLARRLSGSDLAAAAAAMSFALGGLMLSSLKWPNNIAVLGWAPWVLWRAHAAFEHGGRAWAYAALAGACQMLAGTPELILSTWLVVAVIALCRVGLESVPWHRVILRATTLVAAVGAMAAIQLLPFFDLLKLSQRDAHFGASSWGMPPWGPLNLLFPLLFSFPSHQGVYAQYDQYWVASYYPGAAVAILAALSWRHPSARSARVLGLTAAAFLLLAWGDNGVLMPALSRWVPGLGWMRFPIKFIAPVVMLLPLCAAVWIARAEKDPAVLRPEGVRRTLTAFCVVAGVALLAAWLWPMPRDNWGSTLVNTLLRVMLLALLVWLFLRRTAPEATHGYRRLDWLLLALLGCDLLTQAPWLNPTAPSWTAAAGIAEIKPPPTLGQDRAMISPEAEWQLDHWTPPNPRDDYLASRLGLFCNCNLLDGIPKVDGFYSLYPRFSSEVVEALYRAPRDTHSPLQRFLGVSTMTTRGKMASWDRVANPLPWITGGQAPSFVDPAASLSTLLSPTFDPARTVLLQVEDRTHASPEVGAARVAIQEPRWTDRSCVATAEADQPGWVVVAQSWHPGWRLNINGAPGRLFRANHAFLAFPVPAGKSRFELSYHEPRLATGAAISCVAWLAVLLVWAKGARAYRTAARTSGLPNR